MAKPNHGTTVSTTAHTAQAAREDGGPRGIGPTVSEAARNKEPAPDFTDGVITVINEDGTTAGTATTFAEALLLSDDGDTLLVGAGEYEEIVNLDEDVTIIGEEGAILDGSFRGTDAGTQGTLQLFEGASGSTISGLTINAVQGGQAVLNNYGVDVDNVTFDNNVFDAGENTAGTLVYLNPDNDLGDADGFVFTNNTFRGENLTQSGLLVIEADYVTVENNTFEEIPGGTWTDGEGNVHPVTEVGVSQGQNDTYKDVVFQGNRGLGMEDITFG